jgi:hypothetical protein
MRDLRGATYTILCKLHDLERPRKVGKLYAADRARGDFAVVACFKNLANLIRKVLQRCSDDRVASSSGDLCRSIEQLAHLVNDLASSGRPLKRGFLARTLSQHTAIFRDASERNIEVQLDCVQEWSDTYLTVIMMYNNDLGGLRLKKPHASD